MIPTLILRSASESERVSKDVDQRLDTRAESAHERNRLAIPATRDRFTLKG
jgi:hypothetical protein